MSMPEIAVPCKPPRAYNAWLYDRHGVLTQLNGVVVFMDSETHALTEVEPPMYNFCTVLGEIGLSDCQYALDVLRGGPAAICTARPMEVH